MIELTAVGFALLGLVIPEFCSSIGGGKIVTPIGQNIVTSLAFGLISYGLLC